MLYDKFLGGTKMKKKVDFSGVEVFNRAPEGTHVVKVASVEEVTFQGGNEGFKVAFEITKGAGKGARVYENFPLVDTALWKLKSLLVAIGMKADGRVTLDTDKLIGKTLEIDVYHEDYEGKTRAKVGDMRKLVKSKAEDEDDDDIDEDDFDDTDDEDEEEEEKPKKKAPAKKSVPKTKKKPEPEEEDEDDEEDDEEEEKPAKKSKKAAPKTKAKPKKKSEPEDDDDDWDDDDDDEWEDD